AFLSVLARHAPDCAGGAAHGGSHTDYGRRARRTRASPVGAETAHGRRERACSSPIEDHGEAPVLQMGSSPGMPRELQARVRDPPARATAGKPTRTPGRRSNLEDIAALPARGTADPPPRNRR